MKTDRLAWPILLLLLTVLIPSAGVMWMMREAVRNERVATNQRLQEAYRLQLDQAAETLKDRWDTQWTKLSDKIVDGRHAFSFSKIVSGAQVDSVVICDEWGKVVYPATGKAVERVDSETDPQWQTASRLEFVEEEYRKAADAYDVVIQNYMPPIDSLAAILAKARCLEKAGDREVAINVLKSVSAYSVEGARAEYHRCAGYLRLLELSKKSSFEWALASKRLEGKLLEYDERPLRSHQRHFLMSEFERLTGRAGTFPTKDAEALAIQFVGLQSDGIVKLPSGLRPTSIPGVWQEFEEQQKLAALYRTETLEKKLLSLCEDHTLPAGVSFSVAPPRDLQDVLMDVSLGPELGDWKLGLRVTDGNPFNESSKHQNAVYVWIAALTVAATCVLAWLLMAALRQRMKLAQLKNDLVATVSHELKTPLSSIRLLVDTLLQNDEKPDSESGQRQTTEYLQLISAENARLTRLIDNFLTFSRMDRGQQRFDLANVELRDLVEQAAKVFQDHCPQADECLSIRVNESTMLSCDQDSMVTAIVNLLENAWKYSGDKKTVKLTADVTTEHAEISVIDNGVGLTAREAGRVFNRFYQVDQSVARTKGGCGLGLSIVRSIVEAHGGTVKVESQPDVGSAFTIRLPRAK